MVDPTLTAAERNQIAQIVRWHGQCHAEEPEGTYLGLGVENTLLAVERILAARTAPEAVALDVETVARVIFAESEPALYAQEDRGTALWCTVMGQSREVAAAVVAADPRRTVAEVKAEALREAAAWIADGIRYPVEVIMPGIPMPDALWEALVDHVHADVTGEWHGNSLDRDGTDSWLRDEAGLPERDAATSEGVEG